jgi:hypothetical protein
MPVRRRDCNTAIVSRIGEITVSFFLYEDTDEPQRSSEIRFDDSEVVSGATVRMTYGDVMGLMARDLSGVDESQHHH